MFHSPEDDQIPWSKAWPKKKSNTEICNKVSPFESNDNIQNKHFQEITVLPLPLHSILNIINSFNL